MGGHNPSTPSAFLWRGFGGFHCSAAKTEQGLAAPGHPGLVASLVGHGADGWELGH